MSNNNINIKINITITHNKNNDNTKSAQKNNSELLNYEDIFYNSFGNGLNFLKVHQSIKTTVRHLVKFG